MTQETKLGLVIGGVFISCFAFILSSADDGQVVQQQLRALARTGGIPAESIAHTANGRLQLNGDPMPISPRALTATHRPVVHQPNTDDRSHVSPNPPLGQTVVAEADDGTASLTRHASTSDTPPSPPEADATTNSPRENLVVVQNRLANLPQEFDEVVEAPPATPPSPPQHDGPVLVYVVVKGDTLTRIARKNYDSGARKYTQRIYQANRHILKSPDAVRPGQELIIPLDDVPVEPDTQSYTIRKNDRYATIARRELGDEKRWREIFELNRDQFPDPHRIRVGALIKLPAS